MFANGAAILLATIVCPLGTLGASLELVAPVVVGVVDVVVVVEVEVVAVVVSEPDVCAAVLELAPATSAAAVIAAHNVFVRIVMSLLLRV